MIFDENIGAYLLKFKIVQNRPVIDRSDISPPADTYFILYFVNVNGNIWYNILFRNLFAFNS